MAAGRFTTIDAVELTRRAYAAANSGDLDAMAAYYSPECVWDLSRWGLGTHAGLARVRHFLNDWIGSFEEYGIELEQAVDFSNGVVYAVATQTARPRGGRGYLQLHSGSVFVWVDGLAVSATHYRDHAEARVAAATSAAAAGRAPATLTAPLGLAAAAGPIRRVAAPRAR